ncbi:hypothetical protein [Spiractinospora alimapuensis]|nr:hypothetical protein [Spiractinospora alimapuensis]
MTATPAAAPSTRLLAVVLVTTLLTLRSGTDRTTSAAPGVMRVT